jgi:hypothetical protein
MPGRILAAGLLLGLVGCLPETAPLALVPGDNAEIIRRASRPVQRAPATEAGAKRVLGVGDKLLASNRAVGIRPVITTLGVPHEELFHRGADELYISEGLVNQCKTDGQLAGLLALELGRMVAEREVVCGTTVCKPMPRLLPEDVPVGNDQGGCFGPPDGTRLMELAKLEKTAKTPRTPPEPEALARLFLRRAEFDPAEVEATKTLAQRADTKSQLARQMTQR